MWGFEKFNGNRKFTEDDVNDEAFWDAMMNSIPNVDISAIPGIIGIPICTWDEIRENWTRGSKDEKNYPCNG